MIKYQSASRRMKITNDTARQYKKIERKCQVGNRRIVE